MRPKVRVILEQAVEEGVRRGYSRAHKHIENPSEGAIIEHIEEAVMSSIYEYFEFSDTDG
jgi:archaeosine-15-forming tRNA-guanine transglycosylase